MTYILESSRTRPPGGLTGAASRRRARRNVTEQSRGRGVSRRLASRGAEAANLHIHPFGSASILGRSFSRRVSPRPTPMHGPPEASGMEVGLRRNRMRWGLIAVLALVAVPAGAQRLDGIAAVVNDEVVLQSDVEEQLYLFMTRAQAEPDSSAAD